MTIYRLPDEYIFPPPELAEDNGLLAIDGDLSEQRILTAYSMGIFPWYSEGDPILWWSPDPRLVLFPHEFKVSRSLRQAMNKDIFKVTMDTSFEKVIMHCANVHRKSDGGTWITDDMIDLWRYICGEITPMQQSNFMPQFEQSGDNIRTHKPSTTDDKYIH